MEALALAAYTDEVRREVFDALAVEQTDLRDLGGFESFVYQHIQANEIIRVTHISHRSADQIAAELDFVNFLAQNAAAVSAPVGVKPGEPDQLVLTVGEFVISRFRCAPGKPITEADWQPTLFRRWGECIGRFHALSLAYQAMPPLRIDWQSDDNFALSDLPESEVLIRAIADQHLRLFRQLPRSKQTFGLVHGDAHAGNFFINEGQLTFFDFDDCGYQWFGYDVATILFGAVLQPWIETSAEAQCRSALGFLAQFLSGYAKHMPTSALMIESMPLFLKIRELSLYRVIHRHLDVDNLTDWYPIKFMQGRKQRLEAGLPYLELDFKQFASS